METGGGGSLKSDINVTPLVDVMLVILIIFMVVTPLLQKGVSVLLPEAQNVEAVPEDERQVLTVAVKETGELYLGSQATDAARLPGEMRLRRSTNTALQLQIKADRNAKYGDVKRVIRIGREAGFSGAALIAEEIKEGQAHGP